MMATQTSDAGQFRTKYNTLTPAEARRLNRSLFNNKPPVGVNPPRIAAHNPYGTLRAAPVRTASVLHKPRAPPIIVTGLDTTIDQLDAASFAGHHVHHDLQQQQQQQQQQFTRSLLNRSVSIRSASLRPGVGADCRRHTLNSGRTSAMSSRTSLCSAASPSAAAARRCDQNQQRQQSPATNGSISNLSFKSSLDVTDSSIYDPCRLQTASVDLGSCDHLGGLSRRRSIVGDKKQSDLAPTLGSTYKVFQSPFASFKRFFRNHLSGSAQVEVGKASSPRCSPDGSREMSRCQSQSPPAACPPPPSELKSMCYMDSYSNYDDFTRSRNEKMAKRNDTPDSEAWQLASLPVQCERSLTTVYEGRQAAPKVSSFHTEFVSARRQHVDQPDNAGQRQRQQTLASLTRTSPAPPKSPRGQIRPPMHFDDSGDVTLTNDDTLTEDRFDRKLGSGSSMQSLSSRSTTSSVHHQQQRQQQPQAPATPYRFSFAQPLQQSRDLCVDEVSSQKNLGLPPRMPTDQRLSINTTTTATPTPTTNATSPRQDNSSSGNSSNCSSQLNGINNCDRKNSLDTIDKTSYHSNEGSTTSATNTGADCSGYGILRGLVDNDADITLLSETSTLQGDTGIAYYANRCSELERTVANLKDKLIGKEKELTDLQLSQLNNDYTIERLKKQVSTLERQNAQLRALAASKG